MWEYPAQYVKLTQWPSKRYSTRVTNFRKDWYEQLCYRVAALLTGTKIWFSNDAVDIYGKPVANCRVLHSHSRDLSRFWKVERMLCPHRLWWWRQRHTGMVKNMIKVLRQVFVWLVFFAWILTVSLVVYVVVGGW